VTYTPDEIRLHLREAAVMAGLALDEVVLPTSREVEANGLKLHYLDWGREGKPPILFLHGGALTAHTWDLVCLALRQDYHCLAPDMRGHGDSDWSPEADYSHDSMGADVEALVEHLGFDQFTLVGMSMGGVASMAYAGRNHHRLTGFVLVDVGPEGRAPGRQRIQQFVSGPRELDSIEEFVERAVAFNPLRKPELLRRSLHHNLRQTPEGKWTWKYDDRIHHRLGDPERQRRRAELWEAIPKIACPSLVVRGGKSENFYDEDAEKLANALPRGSWVRIEGAGHTVQGDQPAALVEVLRKFLREETGG
jgi:pimeloyl-ACP methyl ester carboxylesterase